MRKSGKPEEARKLELQHLGVAANKANILPLELRQAALSAYNLADYRLAENLLHRVLAADFEVPGSHCHLARICLITERADEARRHADSAWMHRSEAPPYVIPRILWFQTALALLNDADPASHLGRLKTVLSADDAFMEWSMDQVLDHLKPKLTPEDHALLTALVAALSARENLPALDTFPVWYKATAIPLE